MNIRLAGHYHSIDILTVDGWPESTEVKDSKIVEALDQANMKARSEQWPTTDLNAKILDKVRCPKCFSY